MAVWPRTSAACLSLEQNWRPRSNNPVDKDIEWGSHHISSRSRVTPPAEATWEGPEDGRRWLPALLLPVRRPATKRAGRWAGREQEFRKAFLDVTFFLNHSDFKNQCFWIRIRTGPNYGRPSGSGSGFRSWEKQIKPAPIVKTTVSWKSLRI